MNGKDILEAMSYVDERYVDEADQKPAARRIRWVPYAAAVACLGLVLFGVRQLSRPLAAVKYTAITEEAAEAEQQEELSVQKVSGTALDEVSGNRSMDIALPLQMTVKALRRTEHGNWICEVTDPGTGSYALSQEIEIAPPAEGEMPTIQGENVCLEVTYFPDDNSEILHPVSVTLTEP